MEAPHPIRTRPAPAATSRQWRGVIEEYRDRLPGRRRTTPVVTLREGGTPLVPAQVLSERTGCDVHLKVEGANPTGSFKDRGMTMAITKAKEEGAQAVICASTGNTSASAAAYAVRAGMVCAVLVPQGKIALGKMGQALVHGAKHPAGRRQLRRLPHPRPRAVRQVPGGAGQFGQPRPHRGPEDRGVRDRRHAGRRTRHPRPAGRQRGQHHGVLEGLPRVRPALTPVRRRRAARGERPATRTPRMWGFQASGAAPIVRGEAGQGPAARSPPPSGSATRRPGSWRSARGTSRAASSTR